MEVVGLIWYTLVCGTDQPRGLTLKKWLQILSLLTALAISPSFAFASGTITGILTSPTTSVPISNASLTFALSQAGVDVTNTYALATTPITCATSVTGSVVGIKDPLIAPLASAVTSTGSLSGTYYVKIAYYDVTSPTALTSGPSPVLSVSVVGPNNSIQITAPALHPFRAIGYKVYVGTVSGSETLQATTLGWGTTTLTSYSVGSALATNTSTCTMTFNDAIIPSYTSYYVSVVDSRGNKVSGFPQSWYLSGTTINIGSSIPISSSTAKWQTPILSNPLSSYATQSLNSPLTLNGYALTSGNLTVSGHLNLGYSLSLTPSVAINAGTATLATGSNDNAGKITANNAGSSTVTLTFGTAYSTAPSCVAQNNTTANIVKPTSTTSTLTIVGTTGSGDVISYQCFRFGN